MHRARVQSHPHPQPANLPPRLGGQRALSFQSRRQRVGRDRERRAERIASRSEYMAAVGLNARAENGVVTGQRDLHRFRILIPMPRAAFNVREEKCDRACTWRG